MPGIFQNIPNMSGPLNTSRGLTNQSFSPKGDTDRMDYEISQGNCKQDFQDCPVASPGKEAADKVFPKDIKRPILNWRYAFIKTLGEGGFSSVKLAEDLKTGKKYAIKVLKTKGKKMSKIEAAFETEIAYAMKVESLNVVKVVDYGKSGVVVKKSGAVEKVMFIVQELCANGELFEFLFHTGGFQEKFARRIFIQLMEAMTQIHRAGLCHRDLKPENILLDENYNVKIADFGFSTVLSGRAGAGVLNTRLGTESYMAPEILYRLPYNGASVDLFACGIILFILVAQNPPFNKADPKNDAYCKLLARNKHETFWNWHQRAKKVGSDFFSQDFKSLINAMLAIEPFERPSLAEIKSHPWMKGEVATHEEFMAEMNRRRCLVSEAKMVEGKKFSNYDN
mmetsp:Transcript_26078/g.29866  ORF Transcript_26078/g.29866 Transcript_26078/m.29866 type:complete len:395 (+) Transcript_26078:174-1358(+)